VVENLNAIHHIHDHSAYETVDVIPEQLARYAAQISLAHVDTDRLIGLVHETLQENVSVGDHSLIVCRDVLRKI
jgi:hypothetical protein